MGTTNARRVRRLNVTYRDLSLIMRLLVLTCVMVEAERVQRELHRGRP